MNFKRSFALGHTFVFLLFAVINAEVGSPREVSYTNSSMHSTTKEIYSTNVLRPKANPSKSSASNSYSDDTGTTTLRPAVERIFSRKKRFLLAPPGTRLKLTLQMSKKLLANYPTGFTFNIELAVYYPMITSRLDLIPKRLRPTTTAKPKAKGPTAPLIVQIPGSLIRYKAKPATKPPLVQRIDESGQMLQWVDTKPAPPTSTVSQYYTQPLKWQQWSKYGAPGYAQRYEWTPAKQWPQKQPAWLAQNSKWRKWSTTSAPWAANKRWQQKPSKWQQWGNAPATGGKWLKHAHWQRDAPMDGLANISENDVVKRDVDGGAESAINSDQLLDELDEIEPMYVHFPELEEHYEWKHYHSYRDRRQLYHQLDGLSGILGIDLKSCVLRAICDCKRFLLPPGYSMVQDILRQIFTFPTKSGLEDEYSRIVQLDYEKCDSELRSACPFNLLAWLMRQNQD
ncbi:PREDICTED: uncharacterized protein LOC108367218 [Rhagoletis zephyria]|uniref:uncharacterized protein LOC108367218 n=1 Tax=Rhagoletis zephyria TaxID=28612 RepID=UPI0008114561|nr:PREDICTED: uncharacterized protein LOC108367218 [Rhagoletis zephyria]